MSNPYRLCLVGFGNVGRAFAQLLLKKEAELAERYGVAVSVTGIITGSHGAAINPGGIDLAAALDCVGSGGMLDGLSTVETPSEVEAFIRACPADFLFETTPVNPLSGQPALDLHSHRA
jgi:homoserine dehydrogenase